ncbi:hypothetical protein B0H10DRAFT_1958064 [Mycena sp. CBHHK59/15]|nr:hypothetical protein B0H10DRAFT_1958064 [Mycena sp. CBHHK59/15]
MSNVKNQPRPSRLPYQAGSRKTKEEVMMEPSWLNDHAGFRPDPHSSAVRREYGAANANERRVCPVSGLAAERDAAKNADVPVDPWAYLAIDSREGNLMQRRANHGAIVAHGGTDDGKESFLEALGYSLQASAIRRSSLVDVRFLVDDGTHKKALNVSVTPEKRNFFARRESVHKTQLRLWRAY